MCTPGTSDGVPGSSHGDMLWWQIFSCRMSSCHDVNTHHSMAAVMSTHFYAFQVLWHLGCSWRCTP